MKQILTITRKELSGYFGSPMALIFVGVFLTATLFTFFWVDTFFSRGIADVRPLFNWMPILMIFLVAALTMRQWSEEQKSGTMEILLTLPVNSLNLVVGKFVAVMALVCVALGLTVFFCNKNILKSVSRNYLKRCLMNIKLRDLNIII